MSSSLINQAVQAHSSGDIKHAWQLYQQVLKTQPENPVALGNLGIIALETGHVQAAIDLLDQALQQESGYADWHAAMALALQRKGEILPAIKHMQSALALDQAHHHYHCRIADMYTVSGDLDAAIRHYRQALSGDSYQAEALYGLATLAATGDFEFDQTLQEQLDALLENMPEDSPLLARLHFAKAHLLHRQGKHALAFPHFQQGNDLKARIRPAQQQFHAESEQRRLQVLDDAFSDKFIRGGLQSACSSSYPVFMVGMPRSGSTLLAVMLGNHASIELLGEMPYLRNIAASGLQSPDGTGFPINLDHTSAETLQQAAQWYLQQVGANESDASHGIDKMPSNYELLGLIYLLFPNARVIHTCRDPVATLWSCYCQDLNLAFCNRFEDLLLTYRLYRRYMDMWKARLPLQILDVHYEDLVADSEGQCRRVVDFLQLDWDPDCLQRERGQNIIDTASRTQARKPVYTSALQSWRHYADQLQALREDLEDFYPSG